MRYFLLGVISSRFILFQCFKRPKMVLRHFSKIRCGVRILVGQALV